MLFPGSWQDDREVETLLIGVPYDGGSLVKGSARGPKEVRRYAYQIESYSPLFGKDVSEAYFKDVGDIGMEELGKVKGWAEGGKGLLFLGGDHSITPKLVEALKPKTLIHVDAHMDFKDVFGRKDSHACAMKRSAEIIGEENVYHFGVRSWSEEEAHRESFARKLKALPLLSFEGPIYLSIDIDVVDPAFAPGVSTPEPFGESPKDLLKAVVEFTIRQAPLYIDIVEYNPEVEARITGVLAASLVRELLLALHESRNGRF